MGQAREGARHQGVGRIARFIVPFGFDGAADRAARAYARSLDPQSRIEIENVPGEGGLKGVARANALAAAGEATLLLATPSTHVLLPARRGPSAAPAAAFAPLQGIGSAPNVLLASARLDVATVDALIERARREPLVYASAGAGQTIHLCTALFCDEAAIAMEHRPYDGGSALAYGDLLAGRVHVYFDNLLACREAIAAGGVVPLAVSSTHRAAALPDVPTLAECGFPGYALDVWFGVFAANRPPGWTQRASSLAGNPALHEALSGLGLERGASSGEALARAIGESRGRWIQLAERYGA